MGAGNVSQIKNEIIRANFDVQRAFVKPLHLDLLYARNKNQLSIGEFALDMINSSKIICVFGASIGDTDEYWWGKVGEWLKGYQDGLLVIFDVCWAEDDGISQLATVNAENKISERKIEIRSRFLKLSGLGCVDNINVI